METAVTGKYDTNPAVPQGGTLDIPAFGGPAGIRRDPDAKVTPWGGMSYFATFLRVSEMFDRLVADAPFEYASNNAPDVRNVVGTMVLAILAGFRRYCHMDRLRNDAACMELPGLTKIVSDESVRRALKRCDEAKLDAWLPWHEREVTESLLQYAYVIDVDNTVKPIYGRQEGAEVGYNPQKPGRPSHNYHSAFVGTVRMTLTVDVQGGKSHSGTCGLPSLWRLIDSLPGKCRPRLVRGDAGYGTRRRCSARRSARYATCSRSGARATSAPSSGGSRHPPLGSRAARGGRPSTRQSGWTDGRLRGGACSCGARQRPSQPPHPRRGGGAAPGKNATVPAQQEFEFVKDCKDRRWDTFALVTNDTELDPVALTQLYRDGGDCENNFDEYRNQWGWAGFVTRKLKPTRAMARLIAIVANWWNVFCRLADGKRHMEPVTSRPMLLGVVGRMVRSGRQRLMHLTSTHVEADRIRLALDLIGAFLGRISSTAPQLDFIRKWTLILRVAFRKFLCGRPLEPLSDGRQLLLSTSG